MLHQDNFFTRSPKELTAAKHLSRSDRRALLLKWFKGEKQHILPALKRSAQRIVERVRPSVN